MKISLIFPPFINSIRTTLPKFVDDNEGYFPPLGIMSIASYVKKFKPGCELQVIDAALEHLSYAEIAAKVREFGADIAGISCWTFSLIDTLSVAAEIKKSSPKTLVALGGPHVNIYPEETMANGSVDFVVINDGEKSFLELLNQLEGGKQFEMVSNLYFKKAGAVVKSIAEYLEQNLDSLPFPAREWTDYNKYSSLMDNVNPITTMITSRGCPFNCHFCFKQNTGWRYRSVANIIEEMEYCIGLGIRNFFIFDETFTVNKKRILELCSRIKEKSFDIVWSCRARVDTVDEEILDAMKGAGCTRISFGVESASPEVLKLLNKRIDIRQAVKVFDIVRKKKMVSLADFMIACPGEGRAESRATIKLAGKLRPDYVQFSLFTLFPCTKLYDDALEAGTVKGDPWRGYAKNPSPDFKPPLWSIYTENEAVALLNTAYRSFYLRPSYILRRLLSIRSASQAMQYVKAGLSLARAVLFGGGKK